MTVPLSCFECPGVAAWTLFPRTSPSSTCAMELRTGDVAIVGSRSLAGVADDVGGHPDVDVVFDVSNRAASVFQETWTSPDTAKFLQICSGQSSVCSTLSGVEGRITSLWQVRKMVGHVAASSQPRNHQSAAAGYGRHALASWPLKSGFKKVNLPVECCSIRSRRNQVQKCWTLGSFRDEPCCLPFARRPFTACRILECALHHKTPTGSKIANGFRISAVRVCPPSSKSFGGKRGFSPCAFHPRGDQSLRGDLDRILFAPARFEQHFQHRYRTSLHLLLRLRQPPATTLLVVVREQRMRTPAAKGFIC